MKETLLLLLLLAGIACTKSRSSGDKTPDSGGPKMRCGIILQTPTLDSFVYPTYYITTFVAFPEGDEMVHFHDDVTGDHDSSWYLPKYAKDSSYCTTVP